MNNRSCIAAVILGSDRFPYLPPVFSKAAFRNSATELSLYLESKNGLGIGQNGVLNLFGFDGSVEEHDTQITNFLSKCEDDDTVILLYIGHGGFLKDRDYFLTLHNTKAGREHVTAIRMRDIAATFMSIAMGKKVIVILDCCFSGSAIDHWQALDLNEAIKNKTFELFPVSGTALLVAASRNDPAITPDGAKYTMFSEALITTLTMGVSGKSQFLTLRDIGDHTAMLIKQKYGIEGVLPEVHSPRQVNEDIASIELFPNRALPNHGPLNFGSFSEIPPDRWSAPHSGTVLSRIARLFDDKE